MIVLATVSWYSRSDSNNPFSTKPEITVGSHGDNLFFRYDSPQHNKKQTTIILPSKHLPSAELVLPDIKQWDLVTRTIDIDPGIFKSFPPPRSWYVLAPASSIDSNAMNSPQWPKPSHSHGIITTNDAQIHHTDTLENPRGLVIQTGKITTLILFTEINSSDSIFIAQHKEKADLIILKNESSDKARSLRSILRPRYLLCISENDQSTVENFENIFFITSPASIYKFRIAGLKGLVKV